HLRHLEQRQLIQPSPPASARRIQLTDRGRLVALGGRDPFECWRRRWDGKWRIIMFDLPTGRQSARVRLIRWLRRCHFGYLQRSVWVHPDPMVQLRQSLKEWVRMPGLFVPSLAALAALVVPLQKSVSADYGVVIRNGTVYDGGGNAPFV